MFDKRMKGVLTATAASVMLAGCVTVPPNAGSNPSDPWEAFNRQTNEFNMTLDEWILHPLATTYVEYVPEVIRDGVSNFFSNLLEPRNTLNNVLQGKFTNGAVSAVRFVINTTVGIGGIFDVASHMDLTERPEDFGQTLAVWGVGPGPYLVLPFMGPGTVRDTVGSVVNIATEPYVWAFDNEDWEYAIPLSALRAVDLRASLLAADAMLETAIDPYVAMRDAYLMNRINVIYDGNPPIILEKDEFEDEFEDDFEDEYNDSKTQ